MVELIIMIFVIRWFARTAKSLGSSGVLWGFIGAISYYGPVLLFGLVIFPAIAKGLITTKISYLIIGMILNISIGIGFCLLARMILLSKAKAPVDTSN